MFTSAKSNFRKLSHLRKKEQVSRIRLGQGQASGSVSRRLAQPSRLGADARPALDWSRKSKVVFAPKKSQRNGNRAGLRAPTMSAVQFAVNGTDGRPVGPLGMACENESV